MTDDRYIEYVCQYTELKRQQEMAVIANDIDRLKKIQTEIDRLNAKYPRAALYPLLLSEPEQVRLYQKLRNDASATPPPPPITEERYIEYITQYNTLRWEQGAAAIANDTERVKAIQKKIDQLNKKYPRASEYPAHLNEAEKERLNQKLQELQTLEKSNDPQ
ncbi:MAG: hypothetical protein D6675_10085 [Gemmatimonadetes bacterium]|nr:MAG: hypothetical protein D6675_10085 [Gemmatimonadota bacterium]